MKDTIYYRQANLVLDILPLIAKLNSFALKGGTAINYFIRNLPRISVDIDLTYLPIEDRQTTLDSNHELLNTLSEDIMDKYSPVKIIPKLNKTSKHIERLVVVKWTPKTGPAYKVEFKLS